MYGPYGGPFPVQQVFHQHPARFRMLNCGRRWGKSVAAIMEAYFLLHRQFYGSVRLGQASDSQTECRSRSRSVVFISRSEERLSFFSRIQPVTRV